jgi:hypothetical protein
MQENDRKLAWCGIFIIAVIALELAWFLFVGPTLGSPACDTEKVLHNCSEPFWMSPEFWTAAFTFTLTVSTVGLWLQTKRLAEGADDQSHKMADMIQATEKYAKAAMDSAAAAEKALIVSDRPWIEIRAEISGALAFEEDEIVATIDFTLINVGKSPATFVILYTKLHADSSAAQSYAQRTTREHFGSALLGYGNILFPNTPTQPDRREIRLRRSDFIKRIKEIDQSPALNEEKEADRIPFTHSFPGVSAIVFYVLPNDPRKRPKYTTLILDIKLRPKFDDSGCLIEMTGFNGSAGTFDIGALLLEQAFLSGESS